MIDEKQVQKKEDKSVLFIWNTPIKRRVITVAAATDRPSMNGFLQDQPGKHIDVLHGLYETDDSAIVSFLTNHVEYGEVGPDGFRKVTTQEKEMIDTMRKSGKTKESEIVMRMRTAMEAMNL
jgi:hypothetical protein